tara:strand:- start:185 stop:1852 length:1668 start_codon:yes stop_codon:yes gene_type:complete
MKKIILFLFLLSSIYSNGNEISGKWFFKNILKENTFDSTNIKPISNLDFFLINKDGSFEYQISELNLFAKGTWLLKGEKLNLIYTLPKDTSRYYNITLNNNELVLNENRINYVFSKADKSYNTKFSVYNLIRGFIGIIFLIFIAFLFSRNKNKINWILVIKGLLIQIVFAVLILKVPIIQNFFEWFSKIFITILNFTREGSIFLFGDLITNTDSFGYIFAFQVLPTIVFFSALTSILFYYGILQKIVFGFAFLMKKTLKLSGSESLAAAGNIFLGQTESPLLVKPYISKMTMSELLCLMGGGMATIAGGVLAAYIGFLGGTDLNEQLFFAKHLLAASVMSAPAAVVVTKILYPETEEINEEMNIVKEKFGENALDAISLGTTQGLKLAINVGAMLLVFIAFITMINYILKDFFGDLTGLNEWVVNISKGQYQGFSLEFMLGYLLSPVAWIIGVCKEDMILIGQLLGEKTVLNEFVAYISLANLKDNMAFYEERSIIIATYILCGFANFASIGIQIGGIGVLAPERRVDLSKLGILALIAGTLACLFTATIVGMLI